VPGAVEYRVYVTPPPAPHMAGKPGVISGSGSQWIIVVPPSVPAKTVYRASIETVGPGGVVSPRVDFSPVAVQRAPSTTGGTPAAGGTPSTPVAASPTGQACPPGQFVTGFDGAGKILCAAPPSGAPSANPPGPSGSSGTPSSPGSGAIPDAVRAALQQSLSAIAGTGRPLQMSPHQFSAGTLKVEFRPMRYDLTLGPVQVSEGPAGTAVIRVPLSPYRLHADVRTEFAFQKNSGLASLTAPGQAIVQVSIEAGRGNKRRLGSVRSAQVDLSPLQLGASPPIAEALSQVMPDVQSVTRAGATQVVLGALNEALPTLPEF
jgi:hypothetical protein